MIHFHKPEILSPAGNPEKLASAVRFGADAVYLAGREFGMRAAADNFSDTELADAARFLHSQGKKMYLTVNTLPHGPEYPALRSFLASLEDVRPDGFIVADLGVFSLIRELLPWASLHISTQASICSPQAARAWVSLGASRLVLARELTLPEIRAIRESIPDTVELEAFVHGSMCVSYSGRCMLSNHLAGRDANRGACTQPCRWNYTLIEEKRPDERIPVEETPLGTFIMSSKDMCMLEHIGDLSAAGVTSFKLEGRVKSAYYAAVVTNAYRIAADALAAHVAAGGAPETFVPDPALMTELEAVSHREYCTGFYYDRPADNAQLVTKPGYVRDKAYLAVADGPAELPEGSPAVPAERNSGGTPASVPMPGTDALSPAESAPALFRFIQRNKLCVGDRVELLTPGQTARAFTVTALYDADGAPIDSTPHPLMPFLLPVPFAVHPYDILRAAD